jgi:beta-ureidopropionase
MSGKDGMTRRKFVGKAGIGLSALGLTGAVPALPVPAGTGSESKKNSPREAWVLSLSREGLDERDIPGGMLGRIERMSAYKPDLICLPEAFANSAREAQEIPGPLTGRFAEVAKDLGCYIICPLYARIGSRVFNSAVLIDRGGAILGRYDKIHPVSTECESGVTPGSSPPPVFDTDFGRIGIQICFDVYWTGGWQSLKRQGAEIVFWPSMFPGGRMLSALAWMHGFYVVGSSWRDPAAIYDLTGDLLADSGKWEHLACANLNLEKALLEIADYPGRLDEIKKKYGRKVLIRYWGDESWVTLESRSPELRLKSLLDEYDLVPLQRYLEMEEEAQNRFRDPKN